MKIDLKKFRELVTQKYITRQIHPTQPLVIYNYTNKCAFERFWTKESMMARGLITDLEGNIVARPFTKFFNLLEHTGKDSKLPALPLEEFEVYEKLDGCFTRNAKISCYDGTYIKIGDIVSKGKRPILMGVNQFGEVVPNKIVSVFNSGTKNHWLSIQVDTPVSSTTGAGGHPNIIKVTPNHHIWLDGKYKPASELEVGDKLATTENEPDKNVLHLIKSGLLGDGSLSPNGKSYKYTEGHIQKAYSDYIYQLLGECAIKKDVRQSGFGSTIYRTASKTFPILKYLRTVFYPNNKHVIPKDLGWVDDFTIAKLYMDDGSLSHSDKQQDRACFAVNRYTEDDVKNLAGRIEYMYQVKSTVFYSKGWNIRINKGKDNSIKRFWIKIAPYIHPVMRYKLPVLYRKIPFIKPFDSGKITKKLKESRIISTKSVQATKANFSHGRSGFDIETETNNYFVNGILVHNSLAISYWIDGKPYIATRGSFVSEQAIHATKILHEKYLPIFGVDFFYNGYTYLWEFIAPWNKIVVDYGSVEDLYLLAIINTEDGTEIPYSQLKSHSKFPYIKRYDGIKDLSKLQEMEEENKEGFVIRFKSGIRVKCKNSEYIRLHRLVTGVNAKTIWEHLKDGTGIDELLDRVPDEFNEWVKSTVGLLEANYSGYEDNAMLIHDQAKELPTRKEQAEFIMKKDRTCAPIVFSMLDKKPYNQVIWKMIRPVAEKPWRVDIDV